MSGVLLPPTKSSEDMTQFPNFAVAGAAFLTLSLFPNQAGAALVHTYNAATSSNTATTWQDTTGTRNWTLGSTILSASLEVPSAAEWITAAYKRDTAAVPVVTSTADSFVYTDLTVETWVRPGALNADHQVVFESGGGQNGASILLSSDGIRFLGSAGNVRNVDQVLSLNGLVVDDFLQISYVIRGAADTFDVYVRDVAGNTASASLTGVNVTHGGNAASIFRQTGAEINLGGRTDLTGVSPSGLRPFDGEIAIIRIYNNALTLADLNASYQSVLVPEPGSALLAVLGLAVLPRRQRRSVLTD